ELKCGGHGGEIQDLGGQGAHLQIEVGNVHVGRGRQRAVGLRVRGVHGDIGELLLQATELHTGRLQERGDRVDIGPHLGGDHLLPERLLEVEVVRVEAQVESGGDGIFRQPVVHSDHLVRDNAGKPRAERDAEQLQLLVVVVVQGEQWDVQVAAEAL